MLKEKRKAHTYMLILLDILAIISADLLAIVIRFQTTFFNNDLLTEMPMADYIKILLWVIPLCIVIYHAVGLYANDLQINLYRSFKKLILSSILISLILMSLTFVSRSGWNYSRYVLAFSAVFNISFAFLFRIGYYAFIKQKYNKLDYFTNILIVGTGNLAMEYIVSMKQYHEFGYRVKAILSVDVEFVERTILDIPVVGTVDEFERIYGSIHFDEVIIALQIEHVHLGKQILQMCDKEGIRVKFIPAYCEFIKVSMNMELIGTLPTMVVREVPLDDVLNRFCKRVFDILFSLTAIIITSPIMLLVAIGIKLTSPGSVFFIQERVGINNVTFRMLKFRSMRVQKKSDEISQWTTKDDPRKTKFGSFIRKTSLDELPQFFNVLYGHMSVVGPRPERPFWVQQFKEEIPDYMLRHYVKSGITGLAQVNGWRGDTSINERIKCDNYYIQNWSLQLDIKIILLTILKSFVDRNAY